MLGFSPLAGAALASTGDSSQSVTVSINPSGGIERSANNLSTPMLRGAVGFLPEETLFEVVVNGRILGDITNDGSFNTNDVSNALQWEAGTSSAASTAYIEGPMTAYMLANLAAYEGINIAFSSVSMSGVVGTGVTVDVETNVDVNNRLQIAQVSDNLAPAISRTTAGFQPEATLFNTAVNGRKLGDLNDDGSVNVNDVTVALQWDNDSAILPVASASYISGPMNDYMIANFSSFGPAGIGLIFNSPTGVGTVGTGVIVETNKNVATLNNRLQIAQINANNLIDGIGAAIGGQQPEATLFNTLVNGRKLGDLNGSTPTTVNTQDVFIAQKWDFANASLSLASASYISGPMNDYMIANFSSFGPAGIGLIFNSPTGVGTVGTGVTVETNQVIDVDNVGVTATGVVGTDTTVETDAVFDVNNRLQIAQVLDNLAPAISKAVGNQPPNVTLFNTLVNGRKLGDINDNGSLSGQDTFIAQKWDFDNASLSLNDSRYISGPMNDYMIANFSSFGPAGIGLIFNSPTGAGTVGTGVTVETDQVIDVDNVGITATGVVGTGVTVETDQVIDVDNVGITATGVVGTDTTIETDQVIDINNRQEIARTANNLSTPIARASLNIEPEKTLFNVDVNGRKLGDIDNNGSVTIFDSVAAGQWEAGISSATITAYIEGPMSAYMLGNLNAYEGINIAFTTIDPTGAVNDVTVTEGTGVTVSLNNTGITATGVVGTVLIWSAIIPNQPANFIPIIPSQTPAFTPTNPSQSTSFAEIVPSQTSSWTPINPAPSTSWVKTQAA